ncbi:MAG: biotin carboxylase N-terminal domain-containing protein [Thermodesulfobacteriota bacterium]
MTRKKHRILIANRGEIAIRIMEACKNLSLDFVCVYTDEDRDSEHCAKALNWGGDQALYRISSYQDANEIFSVADASGSTAIHPGYGFFAEDFRFARRVQQRSRKLLFIGPSWQLIRDLGDKINTKRLARSLDIPTVPGSDRPIVDDLEAEELAHSLYDFQEEQGVKNPVVLVKASAGGGGMGIEEVSDLDRFRTVLRRVKNYARRQFRDESVLIEQRIFDFNHLEVQIVADRKGRCVHFGTRNCSVQSMGHQKRIEVAPGFWPQGISYAFDAKKVLADIIEYSTRMAKTAGFDNVGTWEWIVSPTGQPFLMEVNTRIQVENGVSAVVSRVNSGEISLIEEQLRLALGRDLGYQQKDVKFEGVGIEYRIIAEDPENKFAPWVGKIENFSWKDHSWLQVHTQVPVDRVYEIPTEFDPNLALAIIWGADLEQALSRGHSFLNDLILEGSDSTGLPLKSNIGFLKAQTDTLLEF